MTKPVITQTYPLEPKHLKINLLLHVVNDFDVHELET